jgi:hypothetical protein
VFADPVLGELRPADRADASHLYIEEVADQELGFGQALDRCDALGEQLALVIAAARSASSKPVDLLIAIFVHRNN